MPAEGVLCPHCGSCRNEVTDTRDRANLLNARCVEAPEGLTMPDAEESQIPYTHRRRRCLRCGATFASVEIAALDMRALLWWAATAGVLT